MTVIVCFVATVAVCKGDNGVRCSDCRSRDCRSSRTQDHSNVNLEVRICGGFYEKHSVSALITGDWQCMFSLDATGKMCTC